MTISTKVVIVCEISMDDPDAPRDERDSAKCAALSVLDAIVAISESLPDLFDSEGWTMDECSIILPKQSPVKKT